MPSSSRSAVDGVLSIGARSIKGSMSSKVRASYFFGRYFVRTSTSAAMKSMSAPGGKHYYFATFMSCRRRRRCTRVTRVLCVNNETSLLASYHVASPAATSKTSINPGLLVSYRPLAHLSTELAACKTLGSSAISSAKSEKSAIPLQFNTVETFLVANYGHRCSAGQDTARKDS